MHMPECQYNQIVVTREEHLQGRRALKDARQSWGEFVQWLGDAPGGEQVSAYTQIS